MPLEYLVPLYDLLGGECDNTYWGPDIFTKSNYKLKKYCTLPCQRFRKPKYEGFEYLPLNGAVTTIPGVNGIQIDLHPQTMIYTPISPCDFKDSEPTCSLQPLQDRDKKTGEWVYGRNFFLDRFCVFDAYSGKVWVDDRGDPDLVPEYGGQRV
ncbi:hypothetical protein AA313_de0205934 [Arthrobotrys entomopaga]|nr:hypothetical protein AA313_de0205934 [Arthrobotrys entomopaga]